jgi:hypothetical protein
MIEQQLRDETEKWLERAKWERKNLAEDGKNRDFLKNIDAYISDCEHFLKENKLILAFEAVIWAWSWISIGKELGIFRTG